MSLNVSNGFDIEKTQFWNVPTSRLNFSFTWHKPLLNLIIKKK